MPRRPSVSPLNGVPTPPGFEAHPERRNPGGWKRSDTARFKLEKMMQMTSDELQAIAKDDKAPLFERKLAIAISKSDWKVIDGMISQVYGSPKQTQDIKADITPKSIEIKVLEPLQDKGSKKNAK